MLTRAEKFVYWKQHPEYFKSECILQVHRLSDISEIFCRFPFMFQEPGKEKFVKHFHFLTWPDHGVPSSENMLAFIRRVNSATPAKGGPTLVHCRYLKNTDLFVIIYLL